MSAVLISEQALAVGVYEKLLTHSLFSDTTVGVHPRETLPNIVGHYYVSINGVSISAGPSHNSSGGVRDHLFSIDLTVFVRSQDYPKDRNWKKYIGDEKTLSYLCSVVDSLIDFQYDLIAIANAFILANEIGSQNQQGFVKPLIFQNATKPQVVDWSEVTGAGARGAGDKRILSYNNARRITSR